MAYDPYAPTQAEREQHYFFVYPGLIASIAVLVSSFYGLGQTVEGMCAMIAGIYVALIAISKRFDDYFVSLAKTGFQWAAIVVGIWLLAHGLLTIFEGYYGDFLRPSGALASEGDRTFQLPDVMNRAWFLAALSATAFHAGFLFSKIKGAA